VFHSPPEGKLLYWPDDDGTEPLESLRDAEAITLDTTKMALFDGRRCHAVTAFEGERYSLVFVTTQGYAKASTADRGVLVTSAWPTEASQLHFAAMLAPPKGNRQRGIRGAWGLEERPAALQRSSTSLVKHRTVLQHVLAFIVAPLDVTTLCALSKTARDTCMDAATWRGGIVDTSSCKPVGRKAFTHWRLWCRARFVLHGVWALENVSLLVSPDIVTWRWQLWNGSPWALVGGKLACMSSSQVPAKVTMKVGRADPLVVAFTDTCTPRQAAAAMTGGPAATVCGVFFNADRTELFENDAILVSAAQPQLSAGAFVTIALENNELRVEVDGSDLLVVPHAEPAERRHFCVAFMDVAVYLHPCWTMR